MHLITIIHCPLHPPSCPLYPPSYIDVQKFGRAAWKRGFRAEKDGWTRPRIVGRMRLRKVEAEDTIENGDEGEDWEEYLRIYGDDKMVG